MTLQSIEHTTDTAIANKQDRIFIQKTRKVRRQYYISELVQHLRKWLIECFKQIMTSINLVISCWQQSNVLATKMTYMKIMRENSRIDNIISYV